MLRQSILKKTLAIKINEGKKTICYSGDGMFTSQTEKLYRNSDLVIHEAYLYDKTAWGHASMIDLIKMAERNNIKCLVLTHINRFLRKKLNKKKISSQKVNPVRNNITKKEISKSNKISNGVKIIIPEPFDGYKI